MMTTINPRWAITTDFKNLQHQLNRFLEPFGRVAQDEDLVSGTWVPSVDVAETQEKILVRVEVPGMKQEDIQIEFENGLLTLKGERKLAKEDTGLTYHRVERAYGNFNRTFTLPRTVDPEKISASYRDGILEIEVPKKEEAKPKQIKIEVK
jgi:HSP20 family protein